MLFWKTILLPSIFQFAPNDTLSLSLLWTVIMTVSYFGRNESRLYKHVLHLFVGFCNTKWLGVVFTLFRMNISRFTSTLVSYYWDNNQNTQDVLGPRLGMNNHLKFPTNNALALISTHNISDTYNLITFCCKLLFGRCLKKLTI